MGRGGSAGDRGKQGGEKREERAEVEIELCEKGGKGERQTDRQQLRVFFRVVVTINPISPRNYVDERWLTERVSTSNFLVLSRSILAVNPPHTTLTSFP